MLRHETFAPIRQQFVAEAPKENPHFIFLKSGADYVLLGRDAAANDFPT